MKNTILVSFDMLIDSDYGLIRMIKNKNYTKHDLFKPGILNLNDLLLLEVLLDREEENPLSVLIYDKYKSGMNNIYNQFIENKYSNILEYSIKTQMLNLIKVYNKTNIIDVTILCKNKLQEQWINGIYDFKTIIASDLSKLNIDSFDAIYIKYFKNCLNFKNFLGKNLYIANYKFNLFISDKETLPKKEIRNNLSESVNVSIIDTFNKEKFIKIKG